MHTQTHLQCNIKLIPRSDKTQSHSHDEDDAGRNAVAYKPDEEDKEAMMKKWARPLRTQGTTTKCADTCPNCKRSIVYVLPTCIYI